ncbi:MAG: c-type cytochrome, partial [Gemmatimonadales bacterium]
MGVSQFLSAQTTSDITGDPISGRRIFEERGCQRCHAIWGNGGTLGPDLATVGAGRSLQQLAGMFWNHTPRMIEALNDQGYRWATFTESELSDVISYIYYVKLFDEPGNAGLGERWFRNKRCVECHSLGGEGGDEGPVLDSLARYLTPIALSAEMWNHGQKMRTRQFELGIPVPTFARREVADIQAYIVRNSSLRNRSTIFVEPPNPNRGEELFTARSCYRCHGLGGRGTAIAPDLTAVTARLSVSAIAGEMWNHSLQMSARMEERNVRFPRFEAGEMADVIAYLYYLNFYDLGGDSLLGELIFFRKGCARCHVGAGA